ncbi:MAG: ABC transporter permease subunit [Gaiellaceae bacterium]
MLSSVFAKTLRERLRAFRWWCLGTLGFVALYGSVYPSISGNKSLNDLIKNYPEALKGFIGFGGNLDIASGAGYLGSEVFSFWGPTVLLAVAISAGAAALAGEEEHGTLDLLLSLPLSRTRCLLEKLAALVCETLALAFVLWILLVVASYSAGMGVNAGNLGAAVLVLLLFALDFGVLALAIGAATGRRALAIGLSATLAVAADVVNALAPLASWLDGVKLASPFYYYTHGDPLRNGVNATDAIILVAIAVAFAAVAPLLFRRRDLAAP